MTYQQLLEDFIQAQQIFIESGPFYALPDLYQIGQTLQENRSYRVDICVDNEYPITVRVTKLSQDILQELFEKPINHLHYIGMGFFKELIDSTCGPDTFHPKFLYSGMRYILPRKLEAAEEVMLSPFCRIADYGPNVLLERRTKVPIFRRSIHSN